MPTRVVTAARHPDGWTLTTAIDGVEARIGFVARLADVDRVCAGHFAPDTRIDLRIGSIPRPHRQTAPAPAPKHKSRRGGSGRTRLR